MTDNSETSTQNKIDHRAKELAELLWTYLVWLMREVYRYVAWRFGWNILGKSTFLAASDAKDLGGGKCKGLTPQRDNSSSAVELDLICAISRELPFDPVVAEDGHIYERSAIESYFSHHQRDASSTGSRLLTSPITRGKMGKKLLASPQTRNVIESLVNLGVITGDLAQRWKEKANAKKQKEELLQKAEQGNVDAMVMVADCYYVGKAGFEEDFQQAYMWYDRARDSGNVRALSVVAQMLLDDIGVVWSEENEWKGFMYLCMAAAKGSGIAAYRLGEANADGRYNLPKNPKEACFWFELSLRDDLQCQYLSDDCKADARKKVDELKN